MNATSPLRMFCKPGLAENRVNIHPNDGADLGMMTTHYPVELDGGSGEIWLLNECPKDAFEVAPRVWERMGKPKRAVLKYDGKRLLIEPQV